MTSARGTAGALSDCRKWRKPPMAERAFSSRLPVPTCAVALTAAATILASETSAPVSVATVRPRDRTITLSHNPSSSAASDEFTITGVPELDTSRKMR